MSDCSCILCAVLLFTQDTCYRFWPVEDDILTVAKMKVTLLNKKSGSDFDTYRMTIQKPNSVSEDNCAQHCLAADIPATYL